MGLLNVKNLNCLALATLLSGALLLPIFTPIAAHSFTFLLTMSAKMISDENKRAIATPGHVGWCKANIPGYVAKWNSYKNSVGRVKYCASPYYTPSWMKYSLKQ